MTAPETRLPTTPKAPDHRSVSHHRPAVIVWRLADDPAARTRADTGDSPLTARLARRLVAVYTDVHDTDIDIDIDIDIDTDSHLRHASDDGGRRYLPVSAPDVLPRAELATLIMLRWPRPDVTSQQHDTTNLLQACRQRLADGGSTIVVIGGDSSGHQEQPLLTAACAAGLLYWHDIVVVDAADTRDAFTYATAPAPAPADAGTPGLLRQRTNTTLMVFGHPMTPERQPRQPAGCTASP